MITAYIFTELDHQCNFVACRLWNLGPVFGKIVIMALVLDLLLNKLLEWWRPSSHIDICPRNPGVNTQQCKPQYENDVENGSENWESSKQKSSDSITLNSTPRRSSRLRHRDKIS